MFRILLLAIIIMIIAVAIMCGSSRLTSRKTFPDHRIGHNKEMRKKKIFCALTQDKIDRSRKQKSKLNQNF